MVDKTRATSRDRAMMYTVVIHMVLLYGSKRWVIEEEIMKVLEAFHHRIDRRIMGKMAPSFGEEGWESPLAKEAT